MSNESVEHNMIVNSLKSAILEKSGRSLNSKVNTDMEGLRLERLKCSLYD